MLLSGHLVDVHARRTYPATVDVADGHIASIAPATSPVPDRYLCPGLVDAHVHVESSMLPPSEFGRLASVHGTVATVSDPHEIANVLGVAGVEWMLEEARGTPVKIAFGAPSCVPATDFETAGARVTAAEVDALLARDDVPYLAEVMNWPGVLGKDPDLLAKIESAHRRGKLVDGHAPGLMGEQAAAYAAAGIHTDHECFTREEAAGKLALGMKVLIREGSAAKNFDALIGLLPAHAGQICSAATTSTPTSSPPATSTCSCAAPSLPAAISTTCSRLPASIPLRTTGSMSGYCAWASRPTSSSWTT